MCRYIEAPCPYEGIGTGCVRPDDCPEVQEKKRRDDLDYPEDVMFADESEEKLEEEADAEFILLDNMREMYRQMYLREKQKNQELVSKAYEWLRARNVLTEASLEGFLKVMEE